MLNGHIDVVPPGDAAAWTTPPWKPDVRDGRLYGRGAVDMKGGLVCALFAAKAIHDAGVRLRGRLSVASVVGEEDGGTGTLATILRGHTADGAIVIEPTELAVIPAQAGSLMFRLIVPGFSAHGCVREEGVNAIEKFLPLFTALRQLEAERCGVATGAANVAGDPHSPLFARYRLPWPIEVGTLQAGDWASSVPDSLVAEGRYGIAIGEEPDAARRALEEAIARASAADPWLAEHPPTVEWWGGRFDPALTDLADPLVTSGGLCGDGRRRRSAPDRRRHLRRRHAPSGQRRRYPHRAVRPRRRAGGPHGRRVRADRPVARRRRGARSHGDPLLRRGGIDLGDAGVCESALAGAPASAYSCASLVSAAWAVPDTLTLERKALQWPTQPPSHNWNETPSA